MATVAARQSAPNALSGFLASTFLSGARAPDAYMSWTAHRQLGERGNQRRPGIDDVRIGALGQRDAGFSFEEMVSRLSRVTSAMFQKMGFKALLDSIRDGANGLLPRIRSRGASDPVPELADGMKAPRPGVAGTQPLPAHPSRRGRPGTRAEHIMEHSGTNLNKVKGAHQSEERKHRIGRKLGLSLANGQDLPLDYVSYDQFSMRVQGLFTGEPNTTSDSAMLPPHVELIVPERDAQKMRGSDHLMGTAILRGNGEEMEIQHGGAMLTVTETHPQTGKPYKLLKIGMSIGNLTSDPVKNEEMMQTAKKKLKTILGTDVELVTDRNRTPGEPILFREARNPRNFFDGRQFHKDLHPAAMNKAFAANPTAQGVKSDTAWKRLRSEQQIRVETAAAAAENARRRPAGMDDLRSFMRAKAEVSERLAAKAGVAPVAPAVAAPSWGSDINPKDVVVVMAARFDASKETKFQVFNKADGSLVPGVTDPMRLPHGTYTRFSKEEFQAGYKNFGPIPKKLIDGASGTLVADEAGVAHRQNTGDGKNVLHNAEFGPAFVSRDGDATKNIYSLEGREMGSSMYRSSMMMRSRQEASVQPEQQAENVAVFGGFSMERNPGPKQNPHEDTALSVAPEQDPDMDRSAPFGGFGR